MEKPDHTLRPIRVLISKRLRLLAPEYLNANFLFFINLKPGNC
ncbi:Uncharacterized protein dnm_021420 [Desulfonema magnum]|uniref:Uncharacterized protein n=1 Tax=Desulfonema magnum TaxID=45655 RepID=A0A975BJ80_9BACT|nr:Uncharacterized protein dnm_021420 [Desulfonema magnum]